MGDHWNSILKRGAAACCVAVSLAVSLALAGCQPRIPSAAVPSEIDNSYTVAEVMLIVATEQNRQEAIYTDQIWPVVVDGSGLTFQQHLLGQVELFLEKLRTLCLMAEAQGIALDDQEKAQLLRLAEDYYGQLTKADREYMKATQEDVLKMYQEYHLANKVVGAMTQDLDLEISDSEAKVIRVMELRADTAVAANEALREIQEEGADFYTVARQYMEPGEINRQLGRGERGDTYEQVAFGLITEEISPVFEQGGSYYILKCVSDYDEAATQDRKAMMSRQRRSDAFEQIYRQFAGERHVDLDSGLFEGMSFLAGDGSTTTNFFELYREYMD